jgi:hypothetical protein
LGGQIFDDASSFAMGPHTSSGFVPRPWAPLSSEHSAALELPFHPPAHFSSNGFRLSSSEGGSSSDRHLNTVHPGSLDGVHDYVSNSIPDLSVGDVLDNLSRGMYKRFSHGFFCFISCLYLFYYFLTYFVCHLVAETPFIALWRAQRNRSVRMSVRRHRKLIRTGLRLRATRLPLPPNLVDMLKRN